MADSSVDPTKTNSGTLWQNFLADVDTALSDLNTKLTQTLSTDTTDLGVFMSSEASLNSKATEFGGPPPFAKKPDWNEILSTNPDPKSKGVHFYTIIKNVLSLQTLADDEQNILSIDLLSTIHDAFLAAYTTKKPVTQEDFVDWIGTTIISLEKSLDVDHQSAILVALNDVVYKASSLSGPSWSAFETAPAAPAQPATPAPAPSVAEGELSADASAGTPAPPAPAAAPPTPAPAGSPSPCSASGATGIWPQNFCPAIWGVITQTTNSNDKIERLTQAILKALVTSLKSYDPNDESSVRDWIETTITGISQNMLSNEQREELITDLEYAVTQIFPQPDQSYFYKHLQTLLHHNIFNSSATTQTTGGTQPVQPSGIEQILQSFFAGKTNSTSITSADIKSLEKAISGEIKKGITKTFNGLADQGAQGELISATYDRQVITRISDFASNLINKLSNDLDLDIPNNSSQSVKAAQGVTSAAVSFRQFANSLVDLSTAFAGEGNRQKSKGANYLAVQQQVNGPSTDPSHSSLEDIANALYLGTGKPEPLIKQSEFNGVQLAAITAGLQTSLKKLLLSDQQDALSALNSMKQQTSTYQDQKYKDYKQDADNYFASLDQYISSRQQFEFDQFNRQIIQQSMDNLTEMIETGELSSISASLAGK